MKKIIKNTFLIVFFVMTLVLAFKVKVPVSAEENYPFEGMVSADSLAVHSEANYKDESVITELAFGSKVNVLNEIKNSSGTFYHVTFDDKEGYIAKSYIVNLNINQSMGDGYREYCDSLISGGFVESYCPYLFYLHQKYPNWTFTADVVNRGLEESSIAEEWKTVLATGNSNYYLSSEAPEKGYYYIKANVIKSFMDPRNLMIEDTIFQFLDFESSKDIVNDQALLKLVGSGLFSDYLEAVKSSSSQFGVNPLHIVSRGVQEGANNRDYSAVTGLYTTTFGRTSHQGYSLDGFYNFYNIGSYKDSKVGYNYTVQRGLAYAAGYLSGDECLSTGEDGKVFYDTTKCEALSYQRPWNSREAAIAGGVDFIASSYVQKGQNTNYFEKFNVSSKSGYTIYTHQYMTNIYAPIRESRNIYSAYNAGGLLNSNFNFIIPVYNDVNSGVAQPVDKNGDARLKEIKVNGNVITGYDMDVLEYPVSVITKEANVLVEGTPNASTSTVEGNGRFDFVDGVAVAKLTATAEDGTTKTYTITVKKVELKDEEEEIKVDKVTDGLNVKIDGSFMYDIRPGYTVQELLNSVTSAGGQAKIVSSSGENKTNGALVTGDIITIMGTVEEKSFTIAVKGDVFNDGVVNLKDFVLVQSHILKKSNLEGIRFYAADVNFDNVINLKDFVLIQSHILNKVML